MNRLFPATIALVALAASGSASATDMPVKAPPLAPVAAPYDWTGFYIGVNGGYSWGNSATDYAVPGLAPFSTSQSMNGWVFGGQAGYNWQFNRNWIFGIEADLQATGQGGDPTLPTEGPVCTGLFTITCTTTTGRSTSSRSKN